MLANYSNSKTISVLGELGFQHVLQYNLILHCAVQIREGYILSCTHYEDCYEGYTLVI